MNDQPMYIYCLTKNQLPNTPYLQSRKQSFTTQRISTDPQTINHHTIYIYCPKINKLTHNIYLLSHNQLLTTQFISTVPQLIN